MNISPEFKRNLKRSFRNESLAKAVHKGNEQELEDALNTISETTGISKSFLLDNLSDVKVLAFDI